MAKSDAAPRTERIHPASLEGVGLNVLHWGKDGDPVVVLLHGGGANAHWWDHLAPRLAVAHHVVALDFRGHGDSDHPEPSETDAFDRDLEALLQHLGDPRPVLAGHSMGGHIAVRYTAARGGVRALVALEIAQGAAPRDRRRARLALLARRSYATREEAVRRYRFLPAASDANETLRRHIAEHSVRKEEDGRFGFKFDARWFGLSAQQQPALEAILCPVLVVRGAESALLTHEGARSLVQALHDATLAEIPDAGHNVHLEKPDSVLDAIETFLAQVDLSHESLTEPGA